MTERDDARPLRLELLGGARLVGPGLALEHLERKAAALLAYVALEREPERSRIAELLWPKAKRATARNNLAQTARRLRVATLAPILGGQERLSLVDVQVDVAELELAVLRRLDFPMPKRESMLLLDGYDFHDCSELAEWLDWRRVQLGKTLRRALDGSATRFEQGRHFAEAVECLEQLRAMEPLSEPTHRRLIRLHAARGDRASALAAYAECERILARELGEKPSRETLDLVARLRSEKASLVEPLVESVATSLCFERPEFVGRRREWARMERAYEQGLGIYVSGPPGIGKSRLLLEFAASKGNYVQYEGRLGDAQVPFSTLARVLRQTLERWQPELEPWVRLELARILPELGPPAGPAPSSPGQLRFLEAVLAVFRACAQNGFGLVVTDDLQFMDVASGEAAHFVMSRFWKDEKQPVRTLLAYRSRELPESAEARLRKAFEAGSAVLIELGGLDADAIAALVQQLDTEARVKLPELGRLTLGNPLFIAEVLRNLGQPSLAGEREQLAVPERIERLLERRLDRLSPTALNLARVAAVLGTELDVDVAARVLGVPALDLAQPWAELEREQVLSRARFVHDLFAESLLRSLPRALMTYLHGRVAEALAERGAEPARIAQHWLAAEDPPRAAPQLVLAARRAKELFRLDEALALLEQAAKIQREHGASDLAFDTLYEGARFISGLEDGPRHTRVIDDLLAQAETDSARARALAMRASMLEARSELAAADRDAERADELARRAHDGLARAEALQVSFALAIRLGDFARAAAVLQQFRAACAAAADGEAAIAPDLLEADLAAATDQHVAAIAAYRRADAALVRFGDVLYARVRFACGVASSELALGRTADAERALELARRLARETSLTAPNRSRLELCAARIDIAHGRIEAALERLTRLADSEVPWEWESQARRWSGELLCWLGAAELGKNQLGIVIEDERTPARVRVEAILAAARASLEPPPPAWRQEVMDLETPLAALDLALLTAADSLERSRACLVRAEELAAREHVLAARMALARSWLETSTPEQALATLEPARSEVLREPVARPLAVEVLALRAECLVRLARDARPAWAEARDALEQLRIPAERWASFRERNPVARLILSATER